MIDVLRIAHLRIAPQEGNSEVGNCEVHPEHYSVTGDGKKSPIPRTTPFGRYLSFGMLPLRSKVALLLQVLL